MFDPSQYHALNGEERTLVEQVAGYTRQYFQNPKFDSSHDFDHVLRVTATALNILEQEQKQRLSSSLPAYSPLTVIIGALLHDVDDKKYIGETTNQMPKVQLELLRLGQSETFAAKTQALVDGVSYTSEVKDLQRVRDLLVAIPELAIVQDADRLDAMGAIGIGRCFAYGAAKTDRNLSHTMGHFDEKLVKLEGMMKTETGRKLAAVRTQRLREFMSWWDEEMNFADKA